MPCSIIIKGSTPCTLAADLSRRGILLLPAQVNFSHYLSVSEGRVGARSVRVGLNRLKSLSRRTADLLLRERGRASFTTLRDLLQRVPLSRACPLWERGTQTVFGDGRRSTRLILVGEQPGDSEDRQGLPFVGPAGRVLDRDLEDGGIEHKEAYVTNVATHFKWTAKGKRRLHQKPNARER